MRVGCHPYPKIYFKTNLATAGFFIACNLEMNMNFPDPADEAAEREQQMIEIALANRARPTMTYTGHCHNGDCGEKTSKGFFCCSECRSDYERIERARQHRRVA